MYRDTTSFPTSTITPPQHVATQTREAWTWKIIARHSSSMKRLLADVDRDALARGGFVSETDARRVHVAVDGLARVLDEQIGDDSDLSQDARETIGRRVQRELLPYVYVSELSERIYTKPLGYAGDYMTIANMYGDVARGIGRIGPVFDRAMRNQPACQAVLNRRGILAGQIAGARARCPRPVTRVTSLASGPAAELFDVFATIDDPRTLHATCVDNDASSLEYVSQRCRERRVSSQFTLHNENLVYLAAGRRRLEIPPQDLVYSIGLIDYFDDKFVVRLLDYVHGLLAPGGKAIFGNFHVDNPSKALMDYVLDWKLIHRTAADMHRLFHASAFGRECTDIRYEDEGVNMFAECIKDAN